MGSPQIEVFLVFDKSTGLPVAGRLSDLSFSSYTDETGSNVTPQPTFSEIGNGAYKFTPSFPSSSHGIMYVVNTGTNTANPYVYRYMRPEDWKTDNLPADPASDTTVTSVKSDTSTMLPHVVQTRHLTEGRWKVDSINSTLTAYAQDGTTILQVWNLKDSHGNPTSLNPFERIPTISIP